MTTAASDATLEELQQWWRTRHAERRARNWRCRISKRSAPRSWNFGRRSKKPPRKSQLHSNSGTVPQTRGYIISQWRLLVATAV